jgi:hypothetical protein
MPVKISHGLQNVHVDEIRTAYHGDEIHLARRAVGCAFRADPLAGTTLAVLTRVREVPTAPAANARIEDGFSLGFTEGIKCYDLGFDGFHNVIEIT